MTDTRVVKSTARKPPRAGMGRVKGTPNKTTAVLKDAILLAADSAGQDMNGKDGLMGYCRFLAEKEPRAFASLLGRVMPLQLSAAVSVDDGVAELLRQLNGRTRGLPSEQ
ncbi:hypothetical protein DTW90_12090 [Neorhizobium sp. P12A]|nr:hypothetical protein DTW90_12090 [Neorhizobium sp. P12A]